MKKGNRVGALIVTGSLAALLSLPAVAAPVAQSDYQYQADRISSQGRITSISREGDQFRVELNHGAYAYYVPASMMRGRDIRVGDQVRIGGLVNGEAVNA